MNHSNFQNCLMAGVGMAIYQSNFKDEIALNDNLNFNVKIRKSNIFRRFGLSKFYPQAKNEINYFCIYIRVFINFVKNIFFYSFLVLKR